MLQKSKYTLIKQGFFTFLYSFYKIFRSLWTLLGGPKHVCPFYPTCGEYGKICFSTLPFHKALFYTSKRILSCHPWREGSIDLPPKNSRKSQV